MDLYQRSIVLKFYIFLYNITLFLLHLFIIVDISNEYIKGKFVYHIHFPLLRLGTALQIFDIFHSILKFTKTNVIAGLIQVFGRLCMLYVIQGNPEIHSHVSTFILVFAWTLIEIFRYPYYALRVWDYEICILTWLRYTAWIPLYPVGLAMEWWSLVKSMRFYYESRRYEIVLLTGSNLNFGIVVGLLAAIVLPLASYKLISQMIHQRRHKFFSGTRKME